MTWLQWAHMGVRLPAGMCSALCTRVSWSLGWGGPTAGFMGAPVPEELALFEILPVEGAAWFGRCQLGDLTLVDPTGLKAAADLRPATTGLFEPGLSRLSAVLRGEAADEADC